MSALELPDEPPLLKLKRLGRFNVDSHDPFRSLGWELEPGTSKVLVLFLELVDESPAPGTCSIPVDVELDVTDLAVLSDCTLRSCWLRAERRKDIIFFEEATSVHNTTGELKIAVKFSVEQLRGSTFRWSYTSLETAACWSSSETLQAAMPTSAMRSAAQAIGVCISSFRRPADWHSDAVNIKLLLKQTSTTNRANGARVEDANGTQQPECSR